MACSFFFPSGEFKYATLSFSLLASSFLSFFDSVLAKVRSSCVPLAVFKYDSALFAPMSFFIFETSTALIAALSFDDIGTIFFAVAFF